MAEMIDFDTVVITNKETGKQVEWKVVQVREGGKGTFHVGPRMHHTMLLTVHLERECDGTDPA